MSMCNQQIIFNTSKKNFIFSDNMYIHNYILYICLDDYTYIIQLIIVYMYIIREGCQLFV
jgi:hypothetical protein